ncbi:L-rhamnose 1-dehydrogenase (NADP(+)) [Candidatus Lokiarchaeum ossiferum]|uniref:L-rhamnose 1-dehydrogenase (NADP(+)) n=1 Tax=Candidatus Lokiarchaeum ossiferum TaxID=2951803 RepID=A0ABY6HSB0_9ARCH|nr:L-rhamnose 1-dehydrogenase (NADP(+)) [Candidatus Lokiarchaeum sp. B-35]
MKWNFEGKTILITGGASGIGLKIATDMAENGANVAIIDLNQEMGNEAVEKLKAITNKEILFFHGSVSDKVFVDASVDAIFNKIGDIDFLVNCAGILRDFLVSRFDEAKWDLTMEVNLKGAAICSQAVVTKWVNLSRAKAKEKGEKYLPTLDNKPRVVIHVASLAAEGNAGQLAYSASKAGVIGMTLTMAKELARYNIRTHALKPTLIETPIIGNLLKKDDGKFRSYYEGRIPFGIGKTSYVSDPVCFLCSEGGYFMNGAIIPINGGKMDGL